MIVATISIKDKMRVRMRTFQSSSGSDDDVPSGFREVHGGDASAEEDLDVSTTHLSHSYGESSPQAFLDDDEELGILDLAALHVVKIDGTISFLEAAKADARPCSDNVVEP